MSKLVDQILAFHIGKEMGFNKDHIHPDMKLEDIGADELDIVEIVMDLEDKFSIQISDEELDALKTVNDVYELVDKKQREKPSNDHLKNDVNQQKDGTL